MKGDAVRPAPVRRAGLSELLPAATFLFVYLAPTLFSTRFLSAMRWTALVQIFLWWAAMGMATLLLTRADSDPAATRRRVLVAGAVGLGLVLLAGASQFVALAPTLAMAVVIAWNLWDAANEGQAALRIERMLGLAMLPCLVLAILATQVIKPWFDHQYRSPELLTAGLLYAELALLRYGLGRRAGRVPVRLR
jgi:hypothetical protein